MMFSREKKNKNFAVTEEIPKTYLIVREFPYNHHFQPLASACGLYAI